jgi:cation diffusion facilitator CzcD-associated flavoprotein CzcO
LFDGKISDLGRRALRWPIVRWLNRQLIYWIHELTAVGFNYIPNLMAYLGKTLVAKYIAQEIPCDRLDLRSKVTPNYSLGCKRVLLSNTYYSALIRDNVHLKTDKLAAITADGIVDEHGNLEAYDAIVLATGFQMIEEAAFDIQGRDGSDLSKLWVNGAEAYKGSTVRGFPNMFMIIGPNTGLGHSSMLLMIESQATYISDAIKKMKDKGLASVEVKTASQHDYNEDITRQLAGTVWSVGGCSSWYKRAANGRNTTLWPGFTFTFMRRLMSFDVENYDCVKL